MRELVRAALCLPGVVGWSGMLSNQASSLPLNISTVPVLMSLISLGTRLNNLAPWTVRLASLAFRTGAGAWLGYLAGSTILPLLGFWCEVMW